MTTLVLILIVVIIALIPGNINLITRKRREKDKETIENLSKDLVSR